MEDFSLKKERKIFVKISFSFCYFSKLFNKNEILLSALEFHTGCGNSIGASSTILKWQEKQVNNKMIDRINSLRIQIVSKHVKSTHPDIYVLNKMHLCNAPIYIVYCYCMIGVTPKFIFFCQKVVSTSLTKQFSVRFLNETSPSSQINLENCIISVKITNK